MSVEALIRDIHTDIGKYKDDVLARIVNGTFKTDDAANTGMAFVGQQMLLMGLVEAEELININLKKYLNPKPNVPEGSENGTKRPAASPARPIY